MLVVTEHSLLSKNFSKTFTPNTFLADSGDTCKMSASLEGMFNVKPYVTDKIDGKNDIMPSVSMGN
jgi:hypothetical protein